MAPFELFEPVSLADAISLLDPEDSSVRPVGGGTAVMLMMKAGVFRPRRLVSLRLAGRGLSDIAVAANGELRIGAMASLRSIERSALVRGGWPMIPRTLLTLSNVRVRNVATLGGHLAHADPHTDLPPLFAALGARVTVRGRGGERTLLVAELSAGYLETVLGLDELITAVVVPPLGAKRAAYLKFTTRSADDWPALGIAVVLNVADNSIRDACVIVSAATDKPTRLAAAEAVLKGGDVGGASGAALLRRAGEAAAAEIELVGDAHGSAPYKKQLLRVGLGRAIAEALNGQSAGAASA